MWFADRLGQERSSNSRRLCGCGVPLRLEKRACTLGGVGERIKLRPPLYPIRQVFKLRALFDWAASDFGNCIKRIKALEIEPPSMPDDFLTLAGMPQDTIVLDALVRTGFASYFWS